MREKRRATTLTRARAFGQRASDVRVDWFRLLDQLKDEGYSLYDVSFFTEIPKSTLIGYKNGSQPPYHQGLCLVQFWAEATGNGIADVPTVNQFSFMA
ncbi:MAG TPA: hypothetical protein DCX52_13995 [Massilia sp.]|nr:hypothetical protein [Massilia sp.]